MMDDDKNVTVVQATRRPDPDDPRDVLEGKRFTDGSGEPVSIMDVFEKLGLVKKKGADDAAETP